MTQARVNLRIVFDATTPEGQPWHKTTIEYVDLPTEVLTQIELAALEALRGLTVAGAVTRTDANAAAKPTGSVPPGGASR